MMFSLLTISQASCCFWSFIIYIYQMSKSKIEQNQNQRQLYNNSALQYYNNNNRRVFTQTNDDDDSQIEKAMNKFGFQFNLNSVNSNFTKNSHKKSVNKLGSASKQKNKIPARTNVVIAANTVQQNINIYTDKKKRELSSKVLFTETCDYLKSVKSKDRLKTGKRDISKKNDNFKKKKTRLEEPKLQKSSKHFQSVAKPLKTLVSQIELKSLKTLNSQIEVKTPPIQIICKIGEGAFGEVYKARIANNKIVAIKKVFQDKKYKNRELQILKAINNDFCMKVLFTFFTKQKSRTPEEPDRDYLNVVMQYYQSNLIELQHTSKKPLTALEIKLYFYQILRGLNYIHSLEICHRDIKPHNILVNSKNHKAVICDFGCAKKLVKNEPNICYICSRCYRAPELIFGSTSYTTMIDMWSVGCVLLELLHGSPLFIGENNVDQLVQIIKVLGTPSKTEVVNMNPQYDLDDYKFPKITAKDWKKILPKVDDPCVSLIKQMMLYSPKERLNAAQALAHEYFDELREQKVYKQVILKQMNVTQPLFSFAKQQLKNNEQLKDKLVPVWYK